MQTGSVVAMYITPAAGERPQAVAAVQAVAGQGLEGDRYYAGTGSYSDRFGPDREVTLIESEALEALQQEHGIRLDPSESRRNILTRNIALNPLVGRVFRVGAVTLRGIRLCDPCLYLENLTQPGVLRGLVHRAGLRAQIVQGGPIQVGDTIVEIDSLQLD